MEAIEYRPVGALKEAERNSRKHTPEQVEQIAASMKQFGWTMPVLIDEGGVLIAGHARLSAAKLLGYDKAPCLVATGWSEAKKTAYQIADNKLSENSTWDDDILQAQIRDLNDADFSLDVLGFPSFQIDGFLNGADDALFDLATEDEDDGAETPAGFEKASEPSKTADGMAQFAVVVPVMHKKSAFALLRQIINSGEADTYSEAFIAAMEAARGHYT